MKVEIKVHEKLEQSLSGWKWPVQRHTTDIIEATDEKQIADGMWTIDKNIWVGVNTADCAPVCMWKDGKVVVVHAGWRGLVDGIIENGLAMFSGEPECFVGPLYKKFEIQKDACYDQISARFGTVFFEESGGKVYFCFEDAVRSIVPKNTQWDGRNTFEDETLASWRRDKNYKFANWTMIRIIADDETV